MNIPTECLPCNRRGVYKIEMLWSESVRFQRHHRSKPQTFRSFEDFNAELRWMAQEGPDMGYDKTDFRVTFEDGEVYEGRYDLHNIKDKQENPNGRCDLLDHIRGHVQFYTGDHKPPWMKQSDYDRIVGYSCPTDEQRQQYRNFLARYLS